MLAIALLSLRSGAPESADDYASVSAHPSVVGANFRLNLAEAFGSHAGNARLRFETARGSVYETEAGISIAVAWGFITHNEAALTFKAIDSLNARIYGLIRR